MKNLYFARKTFLNFIIATGFKSPFKKKALCGKQILKLEIGAGERRMDDWLCSDYLFKSQYILNAHRKWNVHNILDAIYAEMVIASFNPVEFSEFLKNCYLALKEGGILRIVTSHLEHYAQIYLGISEWKTDEVASILDKRVPGFGQRSCDVYGYPINAHNPGFQGWPHDFNSIKLAATNAGFNDVRIVEVGESDTNFLRNLEKRKGGILEYLTLVVEIRK